MPKRSSKRPDVNETAIRVVRIATGEEEPRAGPAKNPAAVELGRLGGKKGGSARAAKLSPERRRAIAKKAANARWERTRSEPDSID